ncbi:MAG: Rrf2 family transcriptional regulator [Bacteroidales bacterium]|nr:Rrf2 family transcriptional regulator [Bacteroidales bacterium]
MKFNTKVRYGVRAMIEIALNESPNGIFQKDISSHQQISNRYLDHIIASLKVSGLISTLKGKKSGYVLTRKPSEISLYDIYKAFESDMQIVECLSTNQHCERNSLCAAQTTWTELNDLIINYLKSKSLADLVATHHQINNQSF